VALISLAIGLLDTNKAWSPVGEVLDGALGKAV
jgi:hypothetical protein